MMIFRYSNDLELVGGFSSFEEFFKSASQLEPKTLRLTKSDLAERNELWKKITNTLPKVREGIFKSAILREKFDLMKKQRKEIEDNRNFEYTVEEITQEKICVKSGQYVSNCSMCNITCHKNCSIADDSEKRKCSAIDRTSGKCEVCPGQCDWWHHKNSPFYFELVKKTVTKTYEQMKEKYEMASTLNTLTVEESIEKEIDVYFKNICSMIREMSMCRARLQEIELTADSARSEDFIDLLIDLEKKEQRQGYQERINVIEEVKSMHFNGLIK